MIFDGLEVLTAFIPAVADVVKGATRKWLGAKGRPNANNPSEWVGMEDATTKRLNALALLDKPLVNVSVWVANLRAAARYVIAITITFAVIVADFTVGGASDGLQSSASAVWFFLFGERSYNYLKGGEK